MSLNFPDLNFDLFWRSFEFDLILIFWPRVTFNDLETQFIDKVCIPHNLDILFSLVFLDRNRPNDPRDFEVLISESEI